MTTNTPPAIKPHPATSPHYSSKIILNRIKNGENLVHTSTHPHLHQEANVVATSKYNQDLDLFRIFHAAKTCEYRFQECGSLTDVDLKALQDEIHALGCDGRRFGFLVRIPRDTWLAGFVTRLKVLSALLNGHLALHIPTHIRQDIRALMKRFECSDYSPHLLRGLTIMRKAEQMVYDIKEEYTHKRDGKVYEHNGLEIGQWWPVRECVLRDGGHHSTSNVFGEVNLKDVEDTAAIGAMSVILTARLGSEQQNGVLYEDVDEGDTIKYCTEMCQRDKRTFNMLNLHRAGEKQTNIRVFRGPVKGSKYAPEIGFRYDGLYKIAGWEIFSREGGLVRYVLQRVKGQESIRCIGLGKRPSSVEVSEWARVQREIGVRLKLVGEKHPVEVAELVQDEDMEALVQDGAMGVAGLKRNFDEYGNGEGENGDTCENAEIMGSRKKLDDDTRHPVEGGGKEDNDGDADMVMDQ